MRIVAARAIPISYPHVREPLSYCFVRLDADDGTVGWGEACDSFGCSYAGVVGAAVDEALAPLLLGEDPTSVERLVAKLRGWTRRRLGDQWVAMQAISGVELALWDLAGKAAGVPVADLVGRVRDAVDVYASSVFLEEGDADWHVELLAPCLDRGVRAVKLRIGTEWRDDLVTLAGVRARLGDDIELMVDANECFTVPTALELADRLHGLGVRWLEEPLPQHHRRGIEEVVRRSPVPVAYGEHLFGLHDFSDCLDRGQASVVQPDPAIVGGLAEARRIAEVAAGHGARVVPHFAAGPVALAATLHLGATVSSVHLVEYAYPLAEMWAATAPGWPAGPDALRDGRLAVPDRPGLGVEVDPTVGERFPYAPPPPRAGMPARFLGDR